MITAAMGFPPDPDEGLHVGYLHSDGTIPVTVENGAVQRHVLIVGGIGSGKSYTRGVPGEELHRLGVPQVNIDVNGEMIDAARELGWYQRPSRRRVHAAAGVADPRGPAGGGRRSEPRNQHRDLIGYTFDILQPRDRTAVSDRRSASMTW